MKLYIKQKVFSWSDKFTIKDGDGTDKYFVEGEIFSFGHKLHITNSAGEEVAFVRQKVMSFLPRYFITVNGVEVAQLVKEFTFLRPKYRLEGTSWELSGDFMAHNYILNNNGSEIMTLSKEWFTWGDSYLLDIVNPADELLCLSIVLAVDCVISDSQKSAGSH